MNIDEEDSNPESRYERLVKPEFKSKMNDEFLKSATTMERLFIHGMNVLEQQNDWLMNQIIERNKNERQLDTRITPVESWAKKTRLYWMFLAGLVAAIGAIIPIANFLGKWFTWKH